MLGVVLALASAISFAGMTVALRPALARGGDALVGAFLMIVVALGVAAGAAVLDGNRSIAGAWPFALAGILGPGVSQVLFVLAVRNAGTSRTSTAVGTAPLAAVFLGIVVLGEPLVGGVVAGAALIVAGGLLLAREPDRPAHVRTIGILFAGGAALAFATRDVFVRWLAVDSSVSPPLAASVTLGSGGLAILLAIFLSRRPLSLRTTAYVVPGVLFGLSYVLVFEAVYRTRVSVVSPLIATESLWGVALSVLFFRAQELVSRRVWAGAALVVLGGVLIGVFR